MRKLAWFTGGFAAAAVLSVYVLAAKTVWILAAVALAASIFWFGRRQICLQIMAILLGLCTGFIWTGGYRMLVLAPSEAMDGFQGQISGIVTSYAKPTSYGEAVDVQLQTGGRHYQTLVYLQKSQQNITPGDMLTVQAEVELATTQYSAEQDLYARAAGYVLIASAKGQPEISTGKNTALRFLPARIAHQLQVKIPSLFPTDTVAFLSALLVGDRSGFDYATKNELSVAGISHVVAISGMHVSMLLALILYLCRRRRKLATAIGIPIVLFYMLMTGASASVVRAAVMQILLLLAPLVRREDDMPTSLSAALLLLLLLNPWSIANLSLQLSFGAMAGLLLFSGGMYQALQAKVGKSTMPKVLKSGVKVVWGVVSTSLGAMVFTVPVVAVNFGLVSVLAVFTNCLTLWAVSLCFQLGIIICLLGFVLPGTATFLAGLLAWLVRYILAVVHWVARLPFAAVYTQSVYVTLWLLFAYGLLLVFLFGVRRKKPAVFASCVIAAGLVNFWLSRFEAIKTQIETTVLDVGQGQCILIRSDAVNLMIDCGGSNPQAAGELACRQWLSETEQSVQVLILTHYDADHAGGVLQVLNRLPVDTIYLPSVEDSTGLRGEIEGAAAEAGTQIQYVQEDQMLQFGQTQLQIFAPVSATSENDASLSVLCSRGSYDILVTGDMTQEGEHRLLQMHNLPKTELFIAGHHGAATSNGAQLLQAIQPDLVAISVGKNNYGHPAQETLNRIAAVGAALYRTDQDQTITVRG